MNFYFDMPDLLKSSDRIFRALFCIQTILSVYFKHSQKIIRFVSENDRISQLQNQSWSAHPLQEG